MNRLCACRCQHFAEREPSCNDLCAACWTEWCQASKKHQPIADRSYLGTFGITSAWIGWISNTAGHLLAMPVSEWNKREVGPRCPDVYCRAMMVRRPGAWKCYRHGSPIVTQERDTMPGTPDVKVKLK